MNQAARTASQSTNTAAGLPRRPRFGAAIVSVAMTGALFATVVLGMTSMAKDREQLVAQVHATTRT
ncbi:hypothetical protein [Scleromatobacter humisilvae]|uniref:Uncharacterized protein n=1 Tax=Scleromatobacter humisilvae TaxID=2897159 RepID=A0A9X2C0L6_9BURK|nr:hypothetical protein [Scleromatobacter humisilvae]MCK9684874.1 hypothetical protein [Scleromatobacter humisilvae]